MKRNHLFIKFANLLKPSNRAESGSAIIFSILLSIIVLSVVSVIIALSLTSVKKTSSSNAYTYFGNAAVAAVNNAVFTANSVNGLAKLNAATSPSTAVKGVYNVNYTDQQLAWEWYATKTSSIPNAEYTITATGYRVDASDEESRTVVSKIRSVRVSSGSYVSATDNIKYEIDPSNLAQWGFYGIDSVQLKNGAVVNSYANSSVVPNTSSVTNKDGAVASNGVVTLGGTATVVSRINSLNYNTNTPVRCSGTNCDITPQKKLDYLPSLDSTTQRALSNCPKTASEYPSFVSSTSGTTLNAGCYNNITIDANTTTASTATSGSPAVIYFKGSLTVKSGKTFNATKVPLTARFFSDTGTSVSLEQGTASTPTRFSGLVTGAQLACTDNGAGATTASTQSNAKLFIYGGLACKTIILSGGTIAWWDELMKDVSPSSAPSKIWSIDTFEDKLS